ncbi:UDP-3-O-acyl-N-acetylglucosamine deacetylase [Oceaniglobus trochenteri]|uniref:UDP-3-O-acyl-N-acetylglucosamine deacetylase n=1 Tax=Oceaniglobus trochenteri TaxID=2763260 RepID=UPI001CFF7743|nr:UDP-3-O-acyl-N-acetylglucosamine deacetylase [Oceaniglobus trochenteri]
MQTTLKSPVTFTGLGLHSGKPVRMTLRPAAAEFGIWFRRTDIADGNTLIPAHWDAVMPSQLCTRITNNNGVTVSTIEHIMAAVAGCGIQNLLIEIDGPEVPILDGSSAPFVTAILARGLRALDAPVRALEVLETVEVRNGDAFARLSPAQSLEMDFHISFPDAAIGVQDKSLNMANGTFVHELCDSRTFCRQADVDAMRAQGLALGGTLDNAVVVDGAQVLSPGGLRHADEAVRHKMLDALGDLALAGAPLLARYTGYRAGHAMTNALLRALFARPGACRMVICDAPMEARLPGAGLSRGDAPRAL